MLFKRTSILRESQGESLPIFEFLPLISKRKKREGKMDGWTRGRMDGWLMNFNELDCLMNFNALEKSNYFANRSKKLGIEVSHAIYNIRVHVVSDLQLSPLTQIGIC